MLLLSCLSETAPATIVLKQLLLGVQQLESNRHSNRTWSGAVARHILLLLHIYLPSAAAAAAACLVPSIHSWKYAHQTNSLIAVNICSCLVSCIRTWYRLRSVLLMFVLLCLFWRITAGPQSYRPAVVHNSTASYQPPCRTLRHPLSQSHCLP